MAEAIVIGAGVMGLAAARGLRRLGHAVTLLERGRTGRAASWASAGIIGATLRDESDPSFHLRRVSRELWPAFAEEVESESGLDPEYREMGCIQLASSGDELDWLRGAGTGELLDSGQLRELEPALSHSLIGGLLVTGGNVEPRRLCRALEISVRRAGVKIETGAEVQSISTSSGRATGVETTDRTYAADLVVLAAGAWSSKIAGVQPAPPVRPQRGQILALDQSSIGITHVLLTPDDPYFVPRADGRLVIGATREEAGWDASLTAGGVAWLLNRAMQIIPAAQDAPIDEIWTGFRPLSADGLPLIGKSHLDGLYFLTGHGPSGIAPLPGSIALLMALIAGAPPPLSPGAFDPLRWVTTR
jgi:glycine oxidase